MTPHRKLKFAARPLAAALHHLVDLWQGVMARKKRMSERLRVIHWKCAWIEIGKSHHSVAVNSARDTDPVRKFGTSPRDFEAMAKWLSACGR